MNSPLHSNESPRDVWALLKSDLLPSGERWHQAIKISVAGMLIVAVQMTLRYEILYPAMTTLLIVTEARGFSTFTRFVLNFVGATFGCAAAVALTALFIQQPMLLLPVMWGYIIAVMYFMGSSRYRSSLFMAGYPFIVITFMSFFDKESAEHIAIMVYKSVITGLACAALVMVFLWPLTPLQAIRKRLRRGLLRSQKLLRQIIDDLSGGARMDVRTIIPTYDRMSTPELLRLLDQAQTDFSFDDCVREHLESVILFESRWSARMAITAASISEHRNQPPQNALNTLQACVQGIDRLIEQLESPDPKARLQPPSVAPADCPEWLLPLLEIADEEPRILSAIGACAAINEQPDVVTKTLRNLKASLPTLFRQPFWPLNIVALKHATKCSSAIMICALFCITLNWDKGIGCVETVMLVAQATFGGTLLIGGLRLVGLVTGFLLSIAAVIFVIPTISTLPGIMGLFGVLLLVAGYGMHGSPRVSTPALQTMIVFDFALLQWTRPDISLYPTMNFSLAVGMGVFVTFMVYRFLWPVRAGDQLAPCLASMLAVVAKVIDSATRQPVSKRTMDEAQLRVTNLNAEFMDYHNNLPLESHVPLEVFETQVQAVTIIGEFCDNTLRTLQSRVAGISMAPEAIAASEVHAKNIDQCICMLRGEPQQQWLPLPHAGRSPWGEWLQSNSENQLREVQRVIRDFKDVPQGVPTLLGLA